MIRNILSKVWFFTIDNEDDDYTNTLAIFNFYFRKINNLKDN